MSRSKWYRRRFDYGNAFIDNDGLCVYCGQKASTLDHFVPLSVIYMLSDIRGVPREKITLECCSECNGIAGSNVFKSVAHKRSYIFAALREKYQRLLDTPEWSENELDELGYALRTFVAAGLQRREWIAERLKWSNKRNPAAAKVAAVRSKLIDRGASSAEKSADRPGITSKGKKSLIATGMSTGWQI
jgi:hypothetical protein